MNIKDFQNLYKPLSHCLCMNKNVSFVLSVFLIVVLTLSVVVAAGVSTKATERTNDTEKNNSARPSAERAKQICEDVKDRRERLKCRLLNKEVSPNNTIEESCKSVFNPNACQRLYENAQKCYETDGTNRDRCFKKVAGFQRAVLAHQAQEDKESIRNYMILVLYNLQERVEKAYEDGKINENEAASLIDQIVEVKQDILSGKTRAQIRYDVQQLKTKWRYTMNDLNSTTNTVEKNTTGEGNETA